MGSNPTLTALKSYYKEDNHSSGCSVARLSRLVWDQEVASSNLAIPTRNPSPAVKTSGAFCFQNVFFLPPVFLHLPAILRYQTILVMKRKDFLLKTIVAVPVAAFGNPIVTQANPHKKKKPFLTAAGKARFGETIKFLGVHPNDLKISSKDTNGQLSVFEYTGLGKAGPALHMHLHQDEIFMVTEGQYRFVVGEETHVLSAGETIFLPREIAHTWIQLTEKGRMIYFLQPAGKMEEFFTLMNNLKERPTPEELDKIHAAHGMKLMGPPLTL